MTTYSIRKTFRLLFYHFGLIARLPLNSFDFAFVTRNLCSIYTEICVIPLIDTLFSCECTFTFLTHHIFLATFYFPLFRGTIEFLNIAEQNTHFYQSSQFFSIFIRPISCFLLILQATQSSQTVKFVLFCVFSFSKNHFVQKYLLPQCKQLQMILSESFIVQNWALDFVKFLNEMHVFYCLFP